MSVQFDRFKGRVGLPCRLKQSYLEKFETLITWQSANLLGLGREGFNTEPTAGPALRG
ncbi:hypothetical protein [Pseudomonas sp. UBA6562]|uniref:hypothetical protein n=1 Tax=Pseudomonas sp. UBA6562 TaxID=1947332 RepID=UPI0025F03732|nr:hypothetical protein [Pseudomonas sp. UBA6562]